MNQEMFKNKYLKYKSKYLELKNTIGGNANGSDTPPLDAPPLDAPPLDAPSLNATPLDATREIQSIGDKIEYLNMNVSYDNIIKSNIINISGVRKDIEIEGSINFIDGDKIDCTLPIVMNDNYKLMADNIKKIVRNEYYIFAICIKKNRVVYSPMLRFNNIIPFDKITDFPHIGFSNIISSVILKIKPYHGVLSNLPSQQFEFVNFDGKNPNDSTPSLNTKQLNFEDKNSDGIILSQLNELQFQNKHLNIRDSIKKCEPAINLYSDISSMSTEIIGDTTYANLTHLQSFNIDPTESRDFDDAISIEKINETSKKIYIHIVDIAHLMPPNSEKSINSFKKAETLYLLERSAQGYTDNAHIVSTLIDKTSSNDTFSLIMDQKRQTITIEILVSKTPDTSNKWIVDDKQIKVYPATIIIKRRYNYDEYDNIIQTAFKNRTQIDEEKQFLHEMYLSLVKTNIVDITKLINETTYISSHYIIEILMVYGNHYISKHIDKQLMKLGDSPCKLKNVYRNHLSSDKQIPIDDSMTSERKDVIKYKNLFSSFPATYSLENKGHSGLKLLQYTHFTSPIRRYFDTIVHGILAGYKYGEIDQMIDLIDKRKKEIKNISTLYLNLIKITCLDKKIKRIIDEYKIIVDKLPFNMHSDVLAMAQIYYYEGQPPIYLSQTPTYLHQPMINLHIQTNWEYYIVSGYVVTNIENLNPYDDHTNYYLNNQNLYPAEIPQMQTIKFYLIKDNCKRVNFIKKNTENIVSECTIQRLYLLDKPMELKTSNEDEIRIIRDELKTKYNEISEAMTTKELIKFINDKITDIWNKIQTESKKTFYYTYVIYIPEFGLKINMITDDTRKVNVNGDDIGYLSVNKIVLNGFDLYYDTNCSNDLPNIWSYRKL
jgi:hypothetical protein